MVIEVRVVGESVFPGKGVQRKPSAKYLDYLAQDCSYICKTFLSCIFKISALPVLSISEGRGEDTLS